MRRVLGLLFVSLISFSALLFTTPLGWDVLLKQKAQVTETVKMQAAQESRKVKPAATVTSPNQKAVQNTPKTSPKLTPEMIAAARAKMLQLINEERARTGAKPLQYLPEADYIAQYRAEDMVKRGYFSHEPPGETEKMIAKGEGVSYGALIERDKKLAERFDVRGENLAATYETEIERGLANMHKSLMNSYSHKQAILDPDYTHVSIGLARGLFADGKLIPDSGYTMVQLFFGSYFGAGTKLQGAQSSR